MVCLSPQSHDVDEAQVESRFKSVTPCKFFWEREGGAKVVRNLVRGPNIQQELFSWRQVNSRYSDSIQGIGYIWSYKWSYIWRAESPLTHRPAEVQLRTSSRVHNLSSPFLMAWVPSTSEVPGVPITEVLPCVALIVMSGLTSQSMPATDPEVPLKSPTTVAEPETKSTDAEQVSLPPLLRRSEWVRRKPGYLGDYVWILGGLTVIYWALLHESFMFDFPSCFVHPVGVINVGIRTTGKGYVCLYLHVASVRS